MRGPKLRQFSLLFRISLGQGLLRRAVSASILAASLAMSACGGAQFRESEYHSGRLHFRIGQLPADFRRLDVTDPLLAFRSDRQRATLLVNGRCGVESDDTSLQALTRHLFLEFTDRKPISERKSQLDGREALRTEIEAALDGVRMHFVAYVLKKNGCVYDFLLLSPPDAAPAAAPFDQFVQGFATLG